MFSYEPFGAAKLANAATPYQRRTCKGAPPPHCVARGLDTHATTGKHRRERATDATIPEAV